MSGSQPCSTLVSTKWSNSTLGEAKGIRENSISKGAWNTRESFLHPPLGWIRKIIKQSIVGGFFTNPFEKILTSKWLHLPQSSGWNILKEYLKPPPSNQPFCSGIIFWLFHPTQCATHMVYATYILVGRHRSSHVLSAHIGIKGWFRAPRSFTTKLNY